MPIGLKIREAEKAENVGVIDPINGLADMFPDLEEMVPDPPPVDEPAVNGDRNAPYRGAPAPATPLSKAQEREVRDELDALIRIGALVWSVPDPHCGDVLNEHSAKIAAQLTTCLKRNPRLLSYLRGTGWFGDWVGLGMVILPVARAVWDHHMAPGREESVPDGSGPDLTAPHVPYYPPYLPRPSTGNPAAGAPGASELG